MQSKKNLKSCLKLGDKRSPPRLELSWL